MTSRFDLDAFYKALNKKRISLGVSWKYIANESRVCASTLSRMADGKCPGVDSIAALATWADLSVDAFIVHSAETKKTPSMPTPKELGRRLSDARRRARLTQKDVEIATGLHRTCIVKIEKGVRNLTAIELGQLAQIYRKDPTELLSPGKQDCHEL